MTHSPSHPQRPPIVAIVGPTATGKTALAIELCRTLGGEIVGADSVQVYRGCDIGAGKPSAEELQGVAHHLLDVAAPDEPLDAARFAELADAAIADVASRGRIPMVVGGTGLWLRALLLGLVELPAVDPALRRSLEARFEQEGGAAMHAELALVDPITAAAVHPHDQLRIVRALEVYAQTGRALGEMRRVHALGYPRYPTLGICLDLPLPLYKTVVSQRVSSMLDRGFEQEVRALLAGYGPGIRALGAVGYRQMVEHLEGTAADSAVDGCIVRATEQYARRQRNWFRGDRTVHLRLTPEQARTPTVLSAIKRHVNATRV